MTDPHEHHECQAFLSSIREQPDDDLPRLVFADWLEENVKDYPAEWLAVLRMGVTT